MGKLGQLLVARGWITVQQLTRALQNQNAVGGRLGTCLLEMEVLGEDLLARSLSEQLGLPAAGIEELRGIPDEVLHLIPEKLARRCRAIPFRLAGGRLDVAMQDPRNLVCQDEIAFASGRRVKVHVLHELRIYEALQRYYRGECPSRYSLLLDRLNRVRYMWGTQGGGAAASQGGQGVQGGQEARRAQGPQATWPGSFAAAAAAERTEVLSALPPEGLLSGPPRMAPPPLPEPALPPLPRRRLFRSRGAPAAEPPAAPPAEAATRGEDGGRAGDAGMAGPAGFAAGPLASQIMSPLEEIDFRAPPPPRGPRGPRREPERQATTAETAEVPAPAAGGLPAQGAGAQTAGALPPAAHPVAAAAGAADLEETLALGPPQARPLPRATPPPAPAERAPAPPPAVEPPRRMVALTAAERAELGLGDAAAAGPPAEPVREAPTTLSDVEQALAGTEDPEEVGRILLGFLAQGFRRVALFQTTREQAIAWMAQGDGIDQEAFARYAVSWKEPSVFLNLRQGSGLHIGPLPPMNAHRELALCWGGGLPRDCLVLPVRLRDRLVIVIYVDGGGRGFGGIDLEQMHRLTAATGAAFERCILSKKRGYAQS
jgi:hypothetical protein